MGIRLLGPLEVDGVRSLEPRDRVVLGVLAVRRGQVVRPEQIADVVWGDEPPKSWVKQVQICVGRLRKSVGADAIETTAGGYRLTIGGEDVDADCFARLVDRGDFLAATGEFDRAAASYSRALAMWRGDPLDDLDGWDPGRAEAARFEEMRRTAEESWLDVRLAAGEHRTVAAEATVFVDAEPLRERRWAILALAQYRCSRQTDALRTLARARRMLVEHVGADPGPELTALEAAILQHDPALDAVPEARVGAEECPYKGLAAYEESDADAFFGRRAEVDACMRRLESSAVLVVAGPSGCGKSSVLRAGLVPALRRAGHDVVVAVPGADPIGTLAAAEHSLGSGSPGVLVVDQFEELFTLGHNEAVVDEVCGRLAERVGAGSVLIVAVRSDHLGGLGTNTALRRLAERGLHLLGPLAGDDLRTAIEQPAALAGLRLEPGLIELLVRDCEGEAGSLPLLSHAMVETWTRREGNTLTVEGYRSTGGIGGAVARSADRLYDGLSADRRDTLRTVLLRLVTPTLDGEPVRCRVPSRVVLGDPARDRVVALLVQSRLVTAQDESFEIAHEALARAWPRLRAWLDDDVSGQRILRHLVVAADGWDSYGRTDGELYRGARLESALEWRAAANPTLTDIEAAFLDASSERDLSERRELVVRAERDARHNRRLRTLLVTVAALFVAATIVGGIAIAQSNRATSERRDATVRELAAAALANIDVDPERSVLLAMAAVERAGDDVGPMAWAAENALHRAVTASRIERRIAGVGGRVDWSPSGDVLAALGPAGSGKVELRDASTGEVVRSIVTDSEPSDVEWDARGRLLGTTHRDGVARVLDAATGRVSFTMTSGDGSGAVAPSFSQDGMSFAAAWPNEEGGLVRVLTPNTGEVHVFRDLPGAQAIAFDPTGARLVVAQQGGEALAIIDLATEDVSRSFSEYRPGGSGMTGVVWSPDGRSIATSADDGSVRVIDADSGAEQMVIPGHGSYVSAVDWSADSTRLVSSSSDGTAKVWGLVEGGGRLLMTLSSQDTRTGATDVSFSPDGTKVVVTGRSRTSVTIWDAGLSGDAEIGTLPAVGFGWNAATFGGDGTHLLTTGGGGAVNVWDAQTLDPLTRIGGTPTSALSPSWTPGIPMTTIGDISYLAATPDGTMVATLDDQGGLTGRGTVQVWDVKTGDLRFTARVGSLANHAAWSPDGQLLAIAGGDGDDGSITLVDREGRTAAVIPVPGVIVGSLEFMPDGERIVATIESFPPYDPDVAAVVVWNWRTGEELQRIDTEAWGVIAGPTDDRIITAPHQEAASQDVTVWNLESGEAELILAGHSGAVNNLAFDATSSRVAAAGGDGAVRVWDAVSGDVQYVLEGHIGLVTAVSFGASGTRLVSTGVDGTVRIWSLDRTELMAIAKAGLTRGLTDGECQEFLHTSECETG